MCGIAGIAGRLTSHSRIEEALTSSAAALAHRGPDDSGVTVDQSIGVALGHRRLAILDLSPAGAQPMTSCSGALTLAFNGEVYNHQRLRAELRADGVDFRGRSDTEVLVEAIDRWGLVPALRRTSGMGALAVIDQRRHTLTLARDRFGEKPIYWCHRGDLLAFASELRALRVLPDVDLRIDPAAATALLRWSYIPHPHTIYTDVQQLAPGHMLTLDLDHPERSPGIEQWWSLPDAVDIARGRATERSRGEAVDELESLLTASVADSLESDVPFGAFLSGGIDSSLVAAIAQRQLGSARLATFTVSMPDLGLDEAAHAAAVAHHLGTDHTTLHLDLQQALGLLPELPRIWDEPFADPSMLPTALLCRAVRRHVTVCIGGDGGDEIFGGYNRHIIGARLADRARRWPSGARLLGARALRSVPARWIDRTGRLVPGARSIPRLGDKVHKAGRLLANIHDPWQAIAGVWPERHLLVAPHSPVVPTVATETSTLDELMLADLGSVLPDQMMVKVDRASMASSLEVRSPLLDERLLAWSWSLPPQLRSDGTTGKLVLRDLARRLVPESISNRTKMGFDPPIGRWLRTDLQPWATALLRQPRCIDEGWLDGAALQRTWAAHQSGRVNHEYPLWGVLMLEAWLNEHHPR